MVGRRTDVVRRTDRLYRAPGLCLPQYSYYLLFAESTLLHLLLLFEQNSSYVTSTFWGSGHPPKAPGPENQIPKSEIL